VQIEFNFIFFWPTFDQKNNFFVDTFEAVLRESNLKREFDSIELEVEFHSVFGWPRKLNPLKRMFRLFLVSVKRKFLGKKILLIWYSGELVRVPKGYDLTLSYSPTLGNNFYLPVWAIYTTNTAIPKKYDRDFVYRWDELLKERPLRNFRDNRIACAFISNPSKARLDFARDLERMGVLDIYGTAVGKSIESKLETSKDYIFQLCLENEESEDYVTEKPFEAWMSGNIPIYKKSGIASPINTKAIVNITNYKPDELRKVLEDLVKDAERLKSIYCQPILSSPLDLKELERLFVEVSSKRIGKH
jgi:hypothetical protein